MFNHILNIIKKLMLFVIVMVFVATIGIIIFFLLDDAGHCREQGGVWDKYEKRCRTDCLTWKEEYGGCIKLLPHQILCFEQNKYKEKLSGCIDKTEDKELCLYNNKAWDNSLKECLFTFYKKQCGKLLGRWTYPKICNL
ncbi:MAG: hypothetical protein E7019_06370 [Alphaproteobacteria bacterium]|nr:hypothetical protein [Alphaproteobacteria bacterium]